MSVIDEIKERLDIVEVIQSYVPLKKAGRTYKGLCPFHSEKTPSFVVFPESGTWHCFGACATGGDVYTFVSKVENLEFGETLKLLARRAGVELQPRSPEQAEADKRQNLLREINQAAATYFHHLLLNSDEAARARTYLQGRGLNAGTLERFQVGYALDQWDGLLRYLTGKRYTPADILEVGLIIERDNKSGYYDRFRGRVIVPIRDSRGRTIGFGGRILGEGVPKYLNSPQSPLFDKSSVLFGLDMSKAGIRTSGQAVIVEGYMDVLMAHQAGIDNVVAQMGTALTEAQLKQLKRHTQRMVLALDSDNAGVQATLRGLDVARQVLDREAVPVPTPRGLIRFEDRLAADIRIVTLPPGRDPDEVIRDNPAAWAQLVARAKPVLDFYFEVLTDDLDLTTAQDKAEAVRRLGPLVAEVGDRVQRTHYEQMLGRMVQVDEQTLRQQIKTLGTPRRTRAAKPQPSTTEPAGPLDWDVHCLSFMLTYPDLVNLANRLLDETGEAPLQGEDMSRAQDRAILTAWQTWLDQNQDPNPKGPFFDTLDENLQERVTALLRIKESHPTLPREDLKDDTLSMVIRIRERNLQRRLRELRFLLEETPGRDAAAMYGPSINQTMLRIRRLQKTINARSMSGRRRQEDALVRVPQFAE